jgi:hypothetical protein
LAEVPCTLRYVDFTHGAILVQIFNGISGFSWVKVASVEC